MESQAPASKIHRHHHGVKFYGSEDSLFRTVAGFLSEGLVAAQPAIIIATREHRAGVLREMTGRLIDVERAQEDGELMVLDAAETLDLFMLGDRPDADLFEQHIGGLIDRTLHGRPRVVARAYGEMVDLLWQDGRSRSAIALEVLWNQLAATHGFALLCGYSMGQFYKQTAQYQEVCNEHTHVLDPDSVIPFESKRRSG
jgi:hypothetical protein